MINTWDLEQFIKATAEEKFQLFAHFWDKHKGIFGDQRDHCQLQACCWLKFCNKLCFLKGIRISSINYARIPFKIWKHNSCKSNKKHLVITIKKVHRVIHYCSYFSTSNDDIYYCFVAFYPYISDLRIKTLLINFHNWTPPA